MADLKAAAAEYFKQAFVVVPMVFIKEDNGDIRKQPLVEWRKWQSQEQTLEEFEALPWDRAEGFEVLCGKRNKEGVSLGIVDFDIKKTSAEAQALGLEALKHFRVTARHKTPTGGEHLIFLSRKPVKTISAYHDVAALELLGEGKLCVMYPSMGYTKLNDNLPTVVDDLEGEFLSTLKAVGVIKVERKTKRELHVRPCFLKLMEKAELTHDQRVALVNELEHQGYSLEQAKQFFHENKSWETEYNREKTDKQIESVYGKYGLFTRNELLERGVCFKECERFEWPDCRPALATSGAYTIGNYVFQVKGDMVLIFKGDKPICPVKLESLLGVLNRKNLAKQLSVDQAELDRIAAKIYAERKTAQNKTAKEEENEAKVFDPEVEAEIQSELAKVLEAENQVEALKPHLDRVLVGEDESKIPIFVLLLGSKYQEAEFKQIVLIKATEGSGKSTLIRNLAEGYKVKDVGRFSAHALDYTNLEGYEILSLKELGSMDMEKQGVSTIKFLSSDDRGYNVEVTVRDEDTGKFKTESYRIPCITVISTTTRLILDSQFERRAWIFSMDETPQQTERVARWKAEVEREKAEVLLGRRKITSLNFSQEVIRRFVAQIKPIKIVIPFPYTLSELLGYDVLRIRGDIDKLYVFVKFYATLNMRRLTKLKEDVYAVTPQVCMEALQIAEKPLVGMLSKMDERTHAILSVLKEIKDVEYRTGEDGDQHVEELIRYDVKDSQIDKKVREQIAVKVGKSEQTIRKFFSSLENSGYVSGDQKKPKTYTLLYDVEEIEDKLIGISAKFKSADILIDKMTKEAQEWLRTGLVNQTSVDRQQSSAQGEPKQGSIEDTPQNIPSKLEEHLPTAEERLTNPSLALKQAGLSEKSSENRLNEKQPMFTNNSQKPIKDFEKWIVKREGSKVYAKDGNVMFQCLACKEKGKTMFFFTEHDLKQHISRLHTGYLIT
jgi:hypothetical protein